MWRKCTTVVVYALLIGLTGCGASDSGESEASGAAQSAAEEVAVPNVIGASLSEAKSAGRQAGLSVSPHRPDLIDGSAEGLVVTAQEPPAGIRVPAGSTVGVRLGPGQRAERYRREAMRETAELARRVCSRIPPRVLARTLGGGAFPRTDTSPNAIGLGYAKNVDINPIPLQRAAYDGCAEGVRAQR